MPTPRKNAHQPTAPHRLAYEAMLRRHGVQVGPLVKSIHDKGGADLLEWLAASTPKGMTIMETVAAICVDAYNEEKDQP